MATGNSVIKAYTRAIKKLEKEPHLAATKQSAGFIVPPGQKRGQRKGYQVFVQVCRYDEELLQNKPETGGLLAF